MKKRLSTQLARYYLFDPIIYGMAACRASWSCWVTSTVSPRRGCLKPCNGAQPAAANFRLTPLEPNPP